MRILPVVLIALLALAVALPAVAAKGVPQDPSTFPPGVTMVTHTVPVAGSEMHVLVNTNTTFDTVGLFICGFRTLQDVEPHTCWAPVKMGRVDGADAYAADTAADTHPEWSEGEIVGYRITLFSPGNEISVPADGSYYKVVVAPDPDGGNTAPGAALLPLVALLALAAGLRRRRLPD